MLAPGRGVNGAGSSDNERHDRIRCLMHDMHDTAKPLRIGCDTGPRVGKTARTLRMQQDCVSFVAGTGFADRLSGSGDGGRLRRPVGTAFAFGLEGIVTERDAAGVAHEPVLIGAKVAEISLPAVDVHRPRGTAVGRVITLDDHPDPAILGSLRLLARITKRPVTTLRSRQPTHGESSQGP